MDRQKLKKPEKVLTNILLGIVLILCSVFSFYCVTFKNANYEKDGKKVECTVYYYQHILKNYDVRVKYKNDSGEWITAQLIMRGFPPHLNDTLNGYVMPDEPHKVYQESNIIITVAMYVLLFLFFVCGIFLVVGMIMSVSRYNFLRKNGKSCTGEIIEVTMQKDSKGKLFYPAKYSYTDDDGNQQTGHTVFDRRPPDNEDKFTVIYARKRNGKYISEMIH